MGRAAGAKLTDKQAAFVQEYCIDRNGKQAAVRAGYEWFDQASAMRSGFYVYLLCNPVDGSIFYVGKGKGDRALVHSRIVSSGESTGNGAKDMRILEIIQAGLSVDVLFFHWTEFESEAYQIERLMIEALSEHKLTNIAGGSVTKDEAATEKAKALLLMMPDRDVFALTASSAALEDYDWVKDALNRCIAWFENGGRDGKN